MVKKVIQVLNRDEASRRVAVLTTKAGEGVDDVATSLRTSSSGLTMNRK
jgi:hypothetical protein